MHAGRSSRLLKSRRGTVLLMIVGVLALIAVIAVVYAAIAQADRRGAAAFVKANKIDDNVDLFADYLARVIADSRLNTYDDPIPGTNPTIFRRSRVAWDFPSVDPSMRSRVANANEKPFSPVGGPYMPWLASIEPTRINTAPLIDALRPYLNARDWFSISNLCPDGRFVNLANLRNNFRAEPGFGTDPRGRGRMSDGLTLFDQNGNVQRTTGTIQLPDGSNAEEFVPEHWTMRQIHAFRPIRDVDRRGGATGAPGPDQDEYYPNQWADTDGDGIGDARWFEMVRVDPSSSNPLNPLIESLLPQDPTIRYFYAVKITDQSGLINVNVATDQLAEPAYDAADPTRPYYKLGLSPSDVDLRGTLSLANTYQRFVTVQPNNPQSGYVGLEQPAGAGPNGPLPTNYNGNNGVPATAYNEVNARAVGFAGYGALRVTINSGVIPKPAPQLPPLGVRWDNFPNEDIGNVFSRLDYYQRVGLNASGIFTGMGAANGVPIAGNRALGSFGVESLLELRAFGSANDSSRRSDLEAVLDGKSDKLPYLFPWYGPLRSNRDPIVERMNKHGTGGQARNDGRASDKAMLMAFADARHRLTTVSGAAPLSSLTPASLIGGADPDRIVEAEAKVDIAKVLKLPSAGLGSKLNDEDRLTYVRLLADALMPYRYDSVNATPDPARNSWGIDQPWKRAVNYGKSAEFAYRSAVHLAVNTWDAIDDDADPDEGGPTVVSVRLSSAGIADRSLFPWTEIALPNAELAQNSQVLQQSEQINVFGIEAQPFITEVVTYAFYTDMPPQRVTGPNSVGGDDEYADSNPDPAQPPVFSEITIDLARSARNNDYIGEVIAFQVTNPFDRAIELDPGSAAPGMKYYFEYAGNAYRLGKYDELAGGGRFNDPNTLILDAGETKVFYCLSRTKAEIENRMLSAARPWNPTQTFSLTSFLDAQFGVGRHVQTTITDVKSGLPLPATLTPPVYGVVDIHNENQTSRFGLGVDTFNPKGRMSVMLWRVMRPRSQSAEAYPSNNNQANDMLVDRLRDPNGVSNTTEPSLYFNFSAVGDQVANTEAGQDPTSPRDNTGFSVVFWGSIRRPNAVQNPLPGEEIVPGMMPPWCIEAKFDQAYDTLGNIGQGPNPPPNAPFYNKGEHEPGARTLGSRDDYGSSAGGDPQYTSVSEMIQALRSSTTTALPTEIRREPRNKMGNDIRSSFSFRAGPPVNVPLPYAKVAVQISLGGKDRASKPRNPGLFSRVGDLLLPLAIGPYQEPKVGLSAPNAYDRLEQQWMSLSEVLAICSDYYSPPTEFTSANVRKFSLYAGACHEVVNPQGPTLLDRGHLVLDAYIPFLDNDRDGFFDYPSSSNSGDRAIGLGIPLALNILDRFRMNSYGSATQNTPGVVNMNTAPLLNMDAVSPLLAPDIDDTATGNAAWMRTNRAANPGGAPPTAGRTALFPDPDVETWDISTSIAAYRDKTELSFRPRGATPSGLVNFVDDPTQPPGNYARYGRLKNTYIFGVREEPGFRSLGELFAVRLRQPNGELLQRNNNNGIDRLGTLAINETPRPVLGYTGVTSTTIPWDQNGDGVYNGTEITAPIEYNINKVDTYDGKIAIANSLMASTSVRSDIFCAWFLVHGYTQSDVENLSSEDALVPSVAKRFVMVVDRSNVVRRGDKPKILLFKEVPL